MLEIKRQGKQMMEKLQKIGLKAITVIGAMIFLVLSYYSFRYTMTRAYSGKLTDNRVSVVSQLLFLTISILLVWMVRKALRNIPQRIVHVIALLVAGIMTALCCHLAKSASFTPVTDSIHLYANALSVLEENSVGIIEKEYFLLYPYQLGLVEIFALLFRVTGCVSVQVIEYAQAILIGLLVYVGFRITRELFHDVCVEIIYLLLMFMFAPLYLYAMFVYGETLGICAAMAGIWMFLMANREANKKHITVLFFLGAMFCLAIACIARGALLVVWIAMMIVQILIFFKRKKILPLMMAALILTGIILGGKLPIRVAEEQSDFDFGKGCPKIMWIAMGLQENVGSSAGSGSYNGFNADNFIELGYDYVKASELAKDAIYESIVHWMQNPKEMISFFKQKTLNQWNEPTYGAFFHTYYMTDQKDWVNNLYFDENINGRVEAFLNHYQFICYLAILGYFLMLFKVNRKEELYILGLVLIGGFCLSLIWEARSRYVYPYMVMILPCVAYSLMFNTDRLAELLKKCGKRVRGRLQNTKE